MKKQLLWLTLAFAVSIPLITSLSVHSAIPPLSEQKLRERATHIVVGQVTLIKTREVPVQYGTNYEHIAKVRIERVDKSLSAQLKPGQTIEVHYTTIKDRKPISPPGSQRQSRPLAVGTKVKLFLVEREAKRFYLLEPNGWQPHSSSHIKR